MREIIFRAKVKDKNELIGKGFRIDENGNLKSEWVFGVPIPHYPDLFLAWNEACNEYEEVTIIPETIGECVNVSDKNGKKIFEHDIVRIYVDLTTMQYVISYDKENARFVVGDTSFTFWSYISTKIEVIGNIHDNSELLQD